MYNIHTIQMEVVWDTAKAGSNNRKHGISFSDAQVVFYDPRALGIEDPDSESESRFILVGADSLGRLITVVYAYGDTVIRLISARKATKSESKIYERRIRFQ